MKLTDFDYDLPRELIAQEPAERRDAARLLFHDPATETTRHLTIADLPELLEPGDVVVVNDTRVRRARLFVHRPSGGRVELFLLGPEAGDPMTWRALANPARKLRVGERLAVEVAPGVPAPTLELEPLERLPHDTDPDKLGPTWRLAFRRAASGAAHAPAPTAPGAQEIETLIESCGHVPLPPYITRHQGQGPDERQHEAHDAERYQTVFAAHPGAVAAPTAGLHLTTDLLEALEKKGVGFVRVTLHVGLGTFAPVEVEDTCDHKMHTEEYELTETAAHAVEACRERGGRVVAVGTTSVRVLESAVDADGHLCPSRGSTDIFITPGFHFQVVDLLLTNFHLPKSTLLMLVSAFIGRERCLALHEEAIAQRYRFFSYGDAMLLERGSNSEVESGRRYLPSQVRF
jgi:S-adenosylmethionine:tRNA ribosyltransferase-isomerase